AERCERPRRPDQQRGADAGQPPSLPAGSGRRRLVSDRLAELAVALRALSQPAEERSAQEVRVVGAFVRPILPAGARLHRRAGRRHLALSRRAGANPVASTPPSDPTADARRRLDLGAIEASLREVQRDFQQINERLSPPRDPLDDNVIRNMVAGYALV